MDRSSKRFWIFAAISLAALLIIAFANLYQALNAAPQAKEISYSRFLDDLDQGLIRNVTLTGHRIAGEFTDNTAFRSYATDDPNLVQSLRRHDVDITAVEPPQTGSLKSLLGTWLPIILLIALAIYFMNRMSRPGGRAMTLGKSKARLLADDRHRVSFADVAGIDEAREDLQEIVEFLRDPKQFEHLGGRIPRGVLMVGPPGTGKTLLARAVAGEAQVPFFTISGSDFVEMFVGIGASRVRDMFEQAKKHAPCIIFMDEIDAVGRRRGAGLGGGNDEREQTLNQLLVEMDGFAANEGVILIAATNRPDVLDPALLRPGRFDREIVVAKPDVVGRERILGIHTRAMPLAPDVDLKVVARGTPGFSGADLMNLVNEAALLAARRRRQTVSMRELEDAKDKVTMGTERRTQLMSDEERRWTAYREGGRAIVAMHVPAADPIHKVSIIPRGRTVGILKQLPSNDQLSTTFEQMTSRLAIVLAGRVTEEMIFGRNQVTSATAGDIEEATKLARLMVTRYGLSDALGTVAYGENQDEVFLGHSVARQQSISEQTAEIIAVEVRKLVDAALTDARRILEQHSDGLEILAAGLLEYETLSGDEIRDLLSGLSPNREADPTAPAQCADEPAASFRIFN